jgi:phospholipid/cholesterol/gamma-HCH transport system ATP-binding protein
MACSPSSSPAFTIEPAMTTAETTRHGAAGEDPIISVRDLVVGFGDRLVMNGLSLDVYRGEVLGFVGGSGQGKSVLTRAILGLEPRRAGTIRVFGEDLAALPSEKRKALEQRWGVLFQNGALFSGLTVKQNIQMPMREMRRLSPRLMDELAMLKIELVGLKPDAANKFPSELSGGMVKRAALARALALDPELVFLDEPTSGLDPVGRRLVRDIIHELRAQGAMVFLNSHLLSEVEITCDRVAFIKHGEVVRVSDLKTLVEGETSVTVRACGLTPEILAGLAQWGCDIRADGDAGQVQTLTLAISTEDALPAITRYLVAQGAQVYALTPQRLSLEELFIQIVGTDGGL